MTGLLAPRILLVYSAGGYQVLWIRGSLFQEGVTGCQTILLVEDDDELRDIIGDLLEESGYDVVPASHGRQAIEYLRTSSERPVLVLLDLMMPIVNGWECLREIKSDDELSSIPVVVMTAMDRDRPPGADLVLKKPLRIADLRDIVERLTRPVGGRTSSPP
jgi:CheY-like chemotaxis protein